MLSRYTIYRRRPADAGPLPEGVRQDTRYRTRHILRPTQEMVEAYLGQTGDDHFARFRRDYLVLLDQRFTDDRAGFDQLAELALQEDVYLGCSCPTQKNPDVRHCHTWLALQFMQTHYPELEVWFPEK
ncbi:hypothetical protein AB1L30_27135 [Bremerella sp. JC817]|uniref:hypothetical protein n=1 Tax=Bremerella sp. JC817 TaxID=3231756 RepID=UPI00345788C9